MKKIANFFKWIGKDLADIFISFAKGDWKTKFSFIIMGFGSLLRGAILRGLAFLAVEVGFIFYMINVGSMYLAKFGTLGTVETHKEEVETKVGALTMKVEQTVYGDNSFMILLYGTLTILIIVLFLFVWRINIRENINEENKLKAGRKLPGMRMDFKSLLDENFDKTLLALPCAGIMLFIVLPILFMILVSFTNFDKDHNGTENLFTWVGMQNYKNLFSFGSSGFGSSFVKILGWTLIWAFFATFLTYFGGIGMALLINKKGVKLKKLWRTILVMTIAIPQFVSLLYVSKLFAADGLINLTLMKWGWIDKAIPFWTNATYARITIILVNMWIGIPYVMLIATGLLMNIPADLYESARIDGANKFQMFTKITMPYMFFVTGPYLLTSFTGNLNNFNVIYLLSGGAPTSMTLVGSAGRTDLLVTWLYKLTVNSQNYKMASVLGIMVFVVVAVISLVVYGLLPSVKDEEGFQ